MNIPDTFGFGPRLELSIQGYKSFLFWGDLESLGGFLGDILRKKDLKGVIKLISAKRYEFIEFL